MRPLQFLTRNDKLPSIACVDSAMCLGWKQDAAQERCALGRNFCYRRVSLYPIRISILHDANVSEITRQHRRDPLFCGLLSTGLRKRWAGRSNRRTSRRSDFASCASGLETGSCTFGNVSTGVVSIVTATKGTKLLA